MESELTPSEMCPTSRRSVPTGTACETSYLRLTVAAVLVAHLVRDVGQDGEHGSDHLLLAEAPIPSTKAVAQEVFPDQDAFL